MSAIIIKKAHPPVFPLIKRLLCSSLCLVLITQNIPMARATERAPLLPKGQEERIDINSSREVRVDILEVPVVVDAQAQNPVPVVQFKPVPVVHFDETLRNPIATVQYEPAILIPSDKILAEIQFRALSDFVQCAYSEAYYNKVVKKYINEAEQQRVEIDTQEKLLNYLKVPALKALTNKPNLAVYLRERSEQAKALIIAINEFIEKDGLLRERNQALLDAFQAFIDTDTQLREQNSALLEEISRQRQELQEISRQRQEKKDAIQTLESKYERHMTLLGIGGLGLSVISLFLGHYIWAPK